MTCEELDALVSAHQAELYRYLRYLGAESPDVAEDLVQETFLAAFQATFRPPGNEPRRMAGWLRGIARNLFFNYCRRRKANPVKVDSEALEEAEVFWAEEFLRDEDGFEVFEALRRCLDSLEKRQRGILQQFYAEKKSRKELAEFFQMTEDGIKTLLRRIRSGLGECIKRRLDGQRATPQ